MIAHHAALARLLGEQLELPDAVLDALGGAYEQWDGRGCPGALEGEAVPLAARLASVAEFAEVAYRVGGVEAAAARPPARRRAVRPHARGADAAEAKMLLSDLDAVGTWDAVIGAEPALGVMLSGERFDAALLAIANFVDLKSPYSLGHASAVADLAAEARGAARAARRPDPRLAAPRRARPRPRPARDLERDLGQAGPLGAGE